MNNHLQTIRDRVIAAVPEIMDLKFGCQIKTLDGVEFYGVGLQDGFDKGSLSSVDEGCGCCSSHRTYSLGEYEILGRPIRLTDVLMTIGIAKCGELVDIRLFGDPVPCSIFLPNWDITFKWNLLTDDLNLQSPETIEFLYNLLK